MDLEEVEQKIKNGKSVKIVGFYAKEFKKPLTIKQVLRSTVVFLIIPFNDYMLAMNLKTEVLEHIWYEDIMDIYHMPKN